MREEIDMKKQTKIVAFLKKTHLDSGSNAKKKDRNPLQDYRKEVRLKSSSRHFDLEGLDPFVSGICVSFVRLSEGESPRKA